MSLNLNMTIPNSINFKSVSEYPYPYDNDIDHFYHHDYEINLLFIDHNVSNS